MVYSPRRRNSAPVAEERKSAKALGPDNPITSCLGVGIGAGFADADFTYPGARINDDDSAFLYQFIGGDGIGHRGPDVILPALKPGSVRTGA